MWIWDEEGGDRGGKEAHIKINQQVEELTKK
jgi:hypothetical protein